MYALRWVLQKIALMLLTLSFVSADVTPESLRGFYGFDWFDPEASSCQKIELETLSGATTCQWVETKSSFLTLADFYKCKVVKGEYMIFKTFDRCLEEYETMQANAP